MRLRGTLRLHTLSWPMVGPRRRRARTARGERFQSAWLLCRVTIQALTEVSLPGPAANGRLSPTSECRRRPTPGTKCPKTGQVTVTLKVTEILG